MRRCTNCGQFCNINHKVGLCILFKIRRGSSKNKQINIYGRKKRFKLEPF